MRECDAPPVTRGYCNKHYCSLMRQGVLRKLRTHHAKPTYTRDIRVRVTPEQWNTLTRKAKAARMNRADFVRDLIESA